MGKETERQKTLSTEATSSVSENEPTVDLPDVELVAKAEQLFRDDQLLPGARLIRQVKDDSLITDELKDFLGRAEIMEKLRRDLYAPTEGSWTKQGESHGNRDFITYYKVEDGGKLKCRIESVIESSLYVPLLSVLNETQLYDTWIPRWTFPFKLGVNRSIKLAQRARVDQVVQLTLDMPWLLANREIVFWGFAEEDGDANRDVGAKLMSVEEGFDNGLVPPPEKGIKRMDFEAEFLFRPCPPDHPALAHTKAKYPEGESLILATFVLYADPKVAFVPHTFMNFATRTAIGTVWRMVLNVSEEVREGERPEHAEVIASKRDFYDWVEERARVITGESAPDGEKPE